MTSMPYNPCPQHCCQVFYLMRAVLLVSVYSWTRSTHVVEASEEVCGLVLGTKPNYMMIPVDTSTSTPRFDPPKEFLSGTNGDTGNMKIDELHGYLYWASSIPASISRARLDGSNRSVISTADGLKGLALDPEAGVIYFSSVHTVNTMNFDGSDHKHLLTVSDTYGWLSFLAIDLNERLVFFATAISIHKVNMDSQEHGVVATITKNYVDGVAIYGNKKRVCWSNPAIPGIECSDYNGQNREEMFKTDSRASGLTIDKDVFYWTSVQFKRVSATRADGTTICEIDVTPYATSVNNLGLSRIDCDKFRTHLGKESTWHPEGETVLFEVKTCRPVQVRLSNACSNVVYVLEFAGSSNEPNNVTIKSTAETSSGISPVTQDCNDKRYFWASWISNVISGGVGLTPGLQEIMRLTYRWGNHKDTVVTVTISGHPADEAHIIIHLPPIQPELEPPVSKVTAIRLNDADNGTCVSLTDLHFYNYEASSRRWFPEPQNKCVLSGLVIKKPVPHRNITSFTVTITGRQLVCSTSHFVVVMRQTKGSSCDVAGEYTACSWNGAVEAGGLTTCVAACRCEGNDCNHVTIRIPQAYEGWALCEVTVD